jgi:ubiquinone/menaquinone biosynthesis C-methylase UbiE
MSMTSDPQIEPRLVPASEAGATPTLADRALARLRSLGRAHFYGGTAKSLWRLAFPYGPAERQNFDRAIRDSYDFHMRLLSRPGMRRVLARIEREDLAMFPFFAASIPLDVWRVLRKRSAGVARIPVRPRDGFPYPDYYLNDFHNQANGNLSMRAALTYEWQIRFLFIGANRLMRQGVIDEIPPGRDLDVLDVACGMGTWIPQARLQGRQHHVTGIDLSPQYLRVARALRRPNATFLQMNAEHLRPEWTDRFDLLTCIWLFHELPPAATERVTAEMVRVLKPGGKLVFMDAAQAEDVPDGEQVVERSSKSFHSLFNEPYFLQYQRLDLRELFARHGLRVATSERWYSSKVVTAYKP